MSWSKCAREIPGRTDGSHSGSFVRSPVACNAAAGLVDTEQSNNRIFSEQEFDEAARRSKHGPRYRSIAPSSIVSQLNLNIGCFLRELTLSIVHL